MKKILFFLFISLCSISCVAANDEEYDIIGTWQVVSGSSGNDLGDYYSEDIQYVWLWTFQKGGVLVIDETDDGGKIYNTTYSLNGDILKIEEKDYKILTYTFNAMTIRYDSEYVEYQGKQVHSWLQFTLKKIEDTAIENVISNSKTVKHIVDGLLLIERDGKFFNASGTQIR